MALYGDKSYNKDRLRKIVTEGSSTIPGCTTINFDYISKERIYNAINNAKFGNLKILKEEYNNLRVKLNRSPMMMDLYEHAYIDPNLFANYSNSLYSFTKKYFPQDVNTLSADKIRVLEYITKELINTKRHLDIYVLKELFNKRVLDVQEVRTYFSEIYGINLENKDVSNALNSFNGMFLQEKQFNNYNVNRTVNCNYNEFSLPRSINGMLRDSVFEKYLIDIVDFGYDYFMDNYYDLDKYRKGFVLYKKYSRKDVARILGWEKDISSTMYGYFLKDNSFPIFVNYDKENDVEARVKYEDAFVNKNIFSWMSKNNRTTDSKELVAISNQSKTKLRIPLFVKKSNDEGKDFYFISDLEYISMKDTAIMKDENQQLPIVNVRFKILDQVQSDIYKYLVE